MFFLMTLMCENLISRKTFFSNPEKVNLKVSPDGKKLSYLSAYEGTLNLWISESKFLEKSKPITKIKGHGIYPYWWSHDNETLLFYQDKNGNENHHIYSVNIKNPNEIKDLTPFEDVKVSLMMMNSKKAHEIIISMNKRNPMYHDIYKLNIKTGKLELIYENNQYSEVLLDNDYKVRLLKKIQHDGSQTIFDTNGQKIFSISPDDAFTTELIKFDATNRYLYALDSRAHNTAALIVFDTKDWSKTVLGHDAKADIDSIIFDPQTKKPIMYGYTYKRHVQKALTQEGENTLELLDALPDGEKHIVSQSSDNTIWIIKISRPTSAPHYYYIDRKNRNHSFLCSTRPALDKETLSNMYAHVIKARDGLELVSYLTLPHSEDDNGKSKHPLPLVLWVHGGPWARDYWGYDPFHQWLANRGYAVLSINFRLSTGFGKTHISAGDGEWGRKANYDLIDAADWAIQQGITTKDKIAIMGASYGGYATLAALTFTPDYFTCGVDIFGRSNLETIMDNIPEYWKPQIAMRHKSVGGNPETKEGREFLRSRSPINFVDNIKKPLLVIQGAMDARIPQSESDKIVEASKKKNLDVMYLLFEDEGHGFRRPQNRYAFMTTVEHFLQKHLGGQVEPIGDAFEGSSGKLLEGKLD